MVLVEKAPPGIAEEDGGFGGFGITGSGTAVSKLNDPPVIEKFHAYCTAP